MIDDGPHAYGHMHYVRTHARIHKQHGRPVALWPAVDDFDLERRRFIAGLSAIEEIGGASMAELFVSGR